jgi:hypothetical protein
MRLVRALI